MKLRYYTIKSVLAVLILLNAGSCFPQKPERPAYPATALETSSKEYHGETITDSYPWLLDAASERTKTWAKAQDNLMREYVRSIPEYEKLKLKVRELMTVTGQSQLPVMAAGQAFYVGGNKERQWDLYIKNGGTEKGVFGAEPPFNPRAILFGIPSPDGNQVAISIASRYFDWKVLNAEDGTISDETMSGRDMGGTRMAWSRDSKSFYYVGNTKENEGARSGFVVKRHRLGETAINDKVVFTPDSDGSKLELTVCRGGDYLVIAEREGAATKAKIHYLKTKTDEVLTLINEANASFVFLGNDGDNFYFETDSDAPRGRVVAIDINSPQQSSWKELIPEGKKPIMGYQSAGGTFLPLMAANKFVVPFQENLRQYLGIYDVSGQPLREIELPSGGLYFNTNGLSALSGNRDSNLVLTRFIGITEPNTILQIDVDTGEISPFSRANTSFDAGQYTSDIIFATNKDGGRIPISLTYKKGLAKNGSTPMIMQVYGAIAFTNYPYFQGDYISWLEMGGIHAVAHIRGGGAFGSGWHQDGIAHKKQNGIDDYIAALEFVTKEGYTSAGKIIANGVSAGTIPVAAVLTQRPDLIGGAVLHYGMMDMISYAELFSTDANHAYMIPEIGSAAVKEDFEVLQRYSPYQNLNDNRCYPPVLALTSDVDTPLDTDSYRFIAALQNLNTKCAEPYLLQMAWGSGHSTFGSQSHPPVDTFADEMGFLIKALDLDVSNWLE